MTEKKQTCTKELWGGGVGVHSMFRHTCSRSAIPSTKFCKIHQPDYKAPKRATTTIPNGPAPLQESLEEARGKEPFKPNA